MEGMLVMKLNKLAGMLGCVAVSMVVAAPAGAALVVQDFESFTVGDLADVADPVNFGRLNPGYPIGSIGNGVPTANVPSSQVLEHNSAGIMATLASIADQIGDKTVTFDFMVDSGTHNVWFRDAGLGTDAILMRFISEPGLPGQFFIQVQGETGSNPPVFESLVNHGDWFRATVNLFDIDPNNLTQGHFSVAFENLTTGAAIVPHAGTGTSTSWWTGAVPVSSLNLLQFESPGNGLAQFDNITFEGPAPALPGDLDGDGFVGITDLNIVLGNWNQNVTAGDPLVGDPSGDGFVGIEDLNEVLGNWNAGTPPQAVNAVPEPATLGLIALGATAMLRRR
jgi:hypothetical protein